MYTKCINSKICNTDELRDLIGDQWLQIREMPGFIPMLDEEEVEFADLPQIRTQATIIQQIGGRIFTDVEDVFIEPGEEYCYVDSDILG